MEVEYIRTRAYYDLNIAVLVDGRIINPAGEPSGVTTINVEGRSYTIKIENRSSATKIRKYAIIPDEIVLAVIYYGDKRPVPIIKWGPGRIEKREESVTRVEENKKVTKRYLAYYYVYEPAGIDVFIKEDYLGTTTELIGKPKVLVEVLYKQLDVTGDTYPIRSELRRLGLRWTGGQWRYVAESREEALRKAREIEEALKDIAEVKIEEAFK